MAKTSQPKKNKPRPKTAQLSKEIEAKSGSFSGLSVDAFLLLDENLNLVDINDAGQKMFGVSKAGVFGKCILDVIPDIKKTGIYKKYRHVLKTGKSIATHLELGDRYLSVQLFKQGDALGMIAADITERKRMEEALRESEVRFRELFENMSSGVAVYKAINEGQDFVFKDFNKAGEGIEKIERRDVIGESVLDVFPGVKDFGLFDVFRRVWRTGNPEHHPISLYKDGRIMGWRDNYVYKLPSGELVAIYDDITERKKAEKALRESEEKYRNLFSNAQVGLFRSRVADGKILECNDLLAKMFGYQNREEFIAKHITSEHYVDPNVRDQELAQMQEKGKVENLEVLVTRQDGSPFWISYSAAIYPERDYIEGVVVDITERKKAEEAVKAERQQFNDVLDALPVYLVLLSPDYHVPFTNRLFRERFGESHGRRCFEYLFGRTEPCEICETYKVLKNMKPLEWEWTGPDGRNYYIFDFPFTDRDGSTLIMEVGIDITERKKTDEALKLVSAYNRNLIEVSLDPLVTVGPDGRITDVNTATEAVTGYARDQLIGTDFSDYFTDPQKARAGYQQVFREGKVIDYALDLRHRNGHVTSVLYNASVYRDEAGRVIGVFAAARDITERKKAEEALKNSQEYLAKLNDSLQEVIFTVKMPERIIAYVNRSVKDVFGYELEECIGKTTEFIYPNKNEYGSFGNKLKEAIEERRDSLHTEHLLRRKNGEVFPAEITTTFFKEDDRITQTISVLRDITERKRAEEEIRASLKEKEALLSEVHHRVKNNFQLISSLLDMVGMRAHNEETIRLCASVHARVHAMGLIHSQLYQSGSFAEVDMGAHVGELSGYLAQVYATNGIKITPVIDASGVYLGITQAVPCALALNEVISNAFEHAFQGRQKGAIEISLRKSAEGMVTMRVKDDGIGMPEDFDIDKTSTLGLKLTRNLVQEQLKGSIQFRRGNGTEVTIEFKVG